MHIERWSGRYRGRNRAVACGGLVWTVATAADTTAGVAGQTRQCLETLDRNLAEAGSDRTRMLSATVYLADITTKAEMDAVWTEWVGDDWRHWPQRACVGAPLAGDTLVEIVVLAARAE